MYMINFNGIEQGVIRLSDKANIPNCIENRDWMEYQEWLSKDPNNQPLAYDPGLLNQ